MGAGATLKKLLKDKNISIKELSELTGIPVNTLYSITGRDSKNLRSDTLQRIAGALKLNVVEMMELTNSDFNKQLKDDTYFLEQKLTQIGFSIGGDEEEGYVWINYPDGTLEVTEDDLNELDQSSSSFLKFKLEELKEKNKNDFKKK